MDKKNIVSKSNFLINQKYSLSLNEQKIILILASMIQPNDKNFNIYTIEIKELANLLGIKDKSIYRKVKNIIDGLKIKGFSIKKENGNILHINWLASAEYFNGKGIVEIELSSKLKPYLLELRNMYTSYKLENILSLKSKYSIRIYEILKSNLFRKKIVLEFEYLVNVLDLNEKSYLIYQNFKNRILISSQKEINLKTDIIFEFEEIKQGKKVIKILFNIKEKNEYLKLNSNDSLIILKKIFEKENFSENDLKTLLEVSNYNIKKIENVYEYSKNLEIRNLVGFMIKLLKDDKVKYISKPKKINCNFTQREYDFDELENKLLGWD